MRIGEIIEVGNIVPKELPMTPVAVPEAPEQAPAEPTPTYEPVTEPEFDPAEPATVESLFVAELLDELDTREKVRVR